MDYKQRFIEFMVRSGVLTFGDFTTKSGRRTPYFINTGNYRTGAQISALAGFYADCLLSHNAVPQVLYGPAYKGIPLCVSCAQKLFEREGLDVGYCFNRKEAKDHGEGGSTVGCKINQGQRVVIIEDVITAGTSVRETVPLLRSLGADIAGLVVSVDRMERGTGELSALQEVSAEYGFPVYSVVTVAEIMDCLLNRPVDGKIYIDDAVCADMRRYLDQYGSKIANNP